MLATAAKRDAREDDRAAEKCDPRRSRYKTFSQLSGGMRHGHIAMDCNAPGSHRDERRPSRVKSGADPRVSATSTVSRRGRDDHPQHGVSRTVPRAGLYAARSSSKGRGADFREPQHPTRVAAAQHSRVDASARAPAVNRGDRRPANRLWLPLPSACPFRIEKCFHETAAGVAIAASACLGDDEASARGDGADKSSTSGLGRFRCTLANAI